MISKEIETLNFMIKFQDARIKKLIDERDTEKAFNKALQADNDRLHDLLDNSEDNVKRVSLLMSELKLNWSM
jgi:hypothetical protein